MRCRTSERPHITRQTNPFAEPRFWLTLKRIAIGPRLVMNSIPDYHATARPILGVHFPLGSVTWSCV